MNASGQLDGAAFASARAALEAQLLDNMLAAPPEPAPAAAPAIAAVPPAAAPTADAPAAPHPVASAQIDAMLGRTYMAIKRYPDAVAAYEKAVKLRPADAGTLADYADALAVSKGGNLEGEPARLLQAALQLEPGHLKALALSGTAAFNRGAASPPAGSGGPRGPGHPPPR